MSKFQAASKQRSVKRTGWRRSDFLFILSLAAAVAVSGCAANSVPKKDAFKDEFAHWGEQARPAGEPGNLVGLSDESRQVERNLGVR